MRANPSRQATTAPATTAPPDKVTTVLIRSSRSGSLYKGVGLRSTGTAMGRFGVAGFMRSINKRATIANATATIARTLVASAVVEASIDTGIEKDMTEPMVPPAPSSESAAARSLHLALPMLTIGWLLLVAVLAMSAVRIQRWEVAPGEAMKVGPRISFVKSSGDVPTRYANANGIHFVTAFGAQLSVLDSILGWIDPHVRVETPKERFGDLSPGDSRRLGYQSMVGAKQIAEYVAMRKLGLDARLMQGDILVEQLVCTGKPEKYSACDVLEIGDTIAGMNGTPVSTLTKLAELMSDRKVGETVSLSVVPYDAAAKKKDPSKARTVEVELMEDPDTPGRAIIGFVPADTRTVTLPFEVEISTGGIAGPSAGLAFTLALLDELTKGNLMGRGKVVATGTINEDGTVGAIGALEQKAVAARERGATLFLVPKGQSDAEVAKARVAGGKSVKIVTVGSVDEALAALGQNGGEALPQIG